MVSLVGAKAYGTATESKHRLVEGKGGVPIDYRTHDFAEVLRSREPEGISFVVDPIGGDVTSRSLDLLKPGWKLVSTAISQSVQGNSSRIAVVLGMLRLPLCSLIHPGKKVYFWDVVTATEKDPALYRHDLRAIFQLLREGRIDPVIGKVMPLEEAPKA